MDYLDLLESEAIYILRETAAQFKNPVILFSGGKDSACVLHLARKAFLPARNPFALLHIDTGHNFAETLSYRDNLVETDGEKLHVSLVEETIRSGRAVEPKGADPSRNALQAVTLLDTIDELKIDALIGGARRDEEKARAKERIFSVRDDFGQWDPRSQRPELWMILNGRLKNGEHMRVFPLSNWTELDVWNYILRERIALPSIYFSHTRRVVKKRSGMMLAECPYVTVGKEEQVEALVVRCRTVGDMTCTGLIESRASTIEEVIREIISSRTSERGLRADDKVSESAMEDRKKQGYF